MLTQTCSAAIAGGPNWLFALFGCGFLLGLLSANLNLSAAPHAIVLTLAIVLMVTGAGVGYWADAEAQFLDKPDPEGPPKIFKK